ncbi:MAG TPA: A/G-specific adenine glycosylase [Spirochaetota bacterium]|nr:A/G-specific adenine glycosylase [Spirochaetota bacterium]HPV42212.1 A/G-specific adenine glycosylase [Spirochaetota bacterium]
MQDDERYDDASIVREFRERCKTERRRGKASAPREGAARIRKFRSVIYGYYRKHRRDFPWRRTDDPYHILVSEIMLQQTQVARVAEKFVEFIDAFPTVEALAAAPLSRVLAVWQGMGYNRRARFLHELAGAVVKDHGGRIPDDPEALAMLPGIGRATAASICAFAFNRPVVFIETNIRAVFIHFFFHENRTVSDRDILPLAEAALDRKEPHHWYSALMDYGAMLKRRHPNPSRKSAHHQKQKPFEGSRRQLRGQVLRALLAHPGVTVKRLSVIIGRPEEAVSAAVGDLVRERMVTVKGRALYL